MSDPRLPTTERHGRVRQRSEPKGPQDRPSSMPRLEGSDGDGQQPSSRTSLVLSVSSGGANHSGKTSLREHHPNHPPMAGGTARKGGKPTSRTGTPPPNSTWSIPSSSRCVRCGKLTCTCTRTRPTEETIRRNLESVKMNTPYERAKLARATDEARREEVRRRQLISDAWMRGFLQLQSQELTERLLASLALKELSRRAEIVRQEEQLRLEASCAIDQHTVLSALVAHEREGRLAITATESEARVQLHSARQALEGITRLLYKETCGRSTVEFQEGAEWDGLMRGVANARERMQSSELQRLAFWKQCEEMRDAVVREWTTVLDQIVAYRAAHEHWVGDLMQRRVAFTESAFRSAHELEREEAALRRGLAEEMAEDAELVVERQRLFARSCQSLLRTEAAARQGIMEDMTSSYHSIFLDFQSEAGEVAEIEKFKAQRRAAEEQSALNHLQAISREEVEAYAALVALEHCEREQRRGWVLSKEGARAEFVQRAVAFLSDVAAEEEEARHALAAAMQHGEMDVHERVAQRDRHCRDLWTAAVAGKDELAKEEHNGRFRLISLMAEHEESIRRWCEYKTGVVVGFIASEDGARRRLYDGEETARDTLGMWFAQCMEATQQRERQLLEATARLLHACDAARCSVAAEEAESFAALTHFEAQSRQHALITTHHRERLEFQLKESHSRAWLQQEEGGERSALHTSMALAQRYLSEEAQQAFQTQLAELSRAEHAARTVIVRAIEEGYQTLYLQERDAQLQAIIAEENRIAEELRAREQCLCEDARLYTSAMAEEEEVLSVPDGEQTCAMRDGRFISHAATAASNDAMRSLKLQLVLQSLRLPDEAAASGLEGTALDYVVAVVEGLNGKRNETRDRVAAVQKAAKDAARRAAQQEAIYLGEKEKKEANAARLERDAEDQERRLQSDKAERQRGNHQIELDRKRLDEVLAQLEERKRDLEKLKTSINKQFGRA